MTGRHRALVLTALALAVPLPALALTGSSGSGLAVSASLQGCGVSGGGISCGINASWGGVEGARYYTASVTAPDGSVTDFGNVGGGGGTTLWVPYAGNGTYTVSVSAYGVDEEGDPELIETDEATPEPDEKFGEVEASEADEGDRAQEIVPAEEDPAAEEPATETETAEPAELPPCPPAPEPPAPEVPEDEAAEGTEPEAVTPAEEIAPTDCVPTP